MNFWVIKESYMQIFNPLADSNWNGGSMRFLFLMILVSCASRVPDVILGPNKALWIGRSLDEVLLHPEFAVRQMTSRKASDGIELLTFKNSGGVQSSGGCFTYNGVSSCSSNSGEIVCNHLFLIKKGLVADYYRSGQCAEEQISFRPRDENRNPIFTEDEKKLLSLQRDIASDQMENCSIVGKLLKSQACK